GPVAWAGWSSGVSAQSIGLAGMAFAALGGQVTRSAQPPWSWSSPRTASRAQLRAPARVTRSVVMRASPRVRARRPPQARRGAGLPPPRGPGGEVRDLALDDGPVRPVALLPGRVFLGGAGALQHRFVRVDGDGAPAPRRGADWPQRAGGAPGPERCPAAAGGR